MEFVQNFGALKGVFSSRQFAKEDVAGVVFSSTIMGYHEFHTRPLVGKDFLMSLVVEPHNRYDSNAILVRAPQLQDIPQELHGKITKETKPKQQVRDVAGKDIGRVPKKVAGVVSEAMREGWVVEGLVMHTGGFVHGGPYRGGGPQLKAMYMLAIKRVHFERVTKGLMKEKLEVYEIKP